MVARMRKMKRMKMVQFEAESHNVWHHFSTIALGDHLHRWLCAT